MPDLGRRHYEHPDSWAQPQEEHRIGLKLNGGGFQAKVQCSSKLLVPGDVVIERHEGIITINHASKRFRRSKMKDVPG